MCLGPMHACIRTPQGQWLHRFAEHTLNLHGSVRVHTHTQTKLSSKQNNISMHSPFVLMANGMKNVEFQLVFIAFWCSSFSWLVHCTVAQVVRSSNHLELLVPMFSRELRLEISLKTSIIVILLWSRRVCMSQFQYGPCSLSQWTLWNNHQVYTNPRCCKSAESERKTKICFKNWTRIRESIQRRRRRIWSRGKKSKNKWIVKFG